MTDRFLIFEAQAFNTYDGKFYHLYWKSNPYNTLSLDRFTILEVLQPITPLVVYNKEKRDNLLKQSEQSMITLEYHQSLWNVDDMRKNGPRHRRPI
jgi:hypothetical protein